MTVGIRVRPETRAELPAWGFPSGPISTQSGEPMRFARQRTVDRNDQRPLRRLARATSNRERRRSACVGEVYDGPSRIKWRARPSLGLQHHSRRGCCESTPRTGRAWSRKSPRTLEASTPITERTARGRPVPAVDGVAMAAQGWRGDRRRSPSCWSRTVGRELKASALRQDLGAAARSAKRAGRRGKKTFAELVEDPGEARKASVRAVASRKSPKPACQKNLTRGARRRHAIAGAPRPGTVSRRRDRPRRGKAPGWSCPDAHRRHGARDRQCRRRSRRPCGAASPSGLWHRTPKTGATHQAWRFRHDRPS